jgi:epoxyqueuosine reductase
MSREMSLTSKLKAKARELGFGLVGVCPAVTPAGVHHFREWLSSGYAGEMSYLADRRQAYEHPRNVLDGARSLLMLALNYRTPQPPPQLSAGHGRVSRYAWGSCDYHDLIRARLRPLVDLLQSEVPGSRVRGVVDTAPLLEREFAQLAGLGWQGKNTMLIHPDLGSWFFLAAVLTDVPLEFDSPFSADHCGTCRACLDICPTNAFPQPYVLDASRCISYLTIELRSALPDELRGGVGEWVFGCDLCQQVCPWNRRAPRSGLAEFEPREDLCPMNLVELFQWEEHDFQQRFRRTPLWRAKRRGLLRNAAIVLGNSRQPVAIGGLTRGLHDGESLIRGACAWALGQVDDAQARQQLRRRLQAETDPQVRDEIQSALAVEER